MDIRAAIAWVLGRRDLAANEMAQVMRAIMEGQVTPGQLGAFLVALRLKGESADEIVGAAQVLREKVTRVRVPADKSVVLDTCGTGGDGLGTINISTIAALVVASCGVIVAKHGNRAASSRSGSADLLEALGLRIDAPAAVVERCIREVGFGFCFAQQLHGALKHAAPVRREIGVRTIFNLLGPLANPAFATHQLLGIYDAALLEPVARALRDLGVVRAWVVHGQGLDEVAPSGITDVVALENGTLRQLKVSPADAGLPEHGVDEISGGDPRQNAEATRKLLAGERGAKRDVVLMNAACALMVAGQTNDLRDGVSRAAAAIDSGAAQEKLARVIAVSRTEP